MKPQLIHIPKTGGSTLRHLFRQWSPIGNGHETFMDLRDPTSAQEFFAFLREPLDRAVSLYRFMEQSPHKVFPNKCERLMKEMLRFLSGPSEFWEKVNLEEVQATIVHFMPQTHWLSGATLGIDVRLYDFARFESEVARLCAEFDLPPMPVSQTIYKTRRGTVQEELSAKAQARIQDLYAVDVDLYEHWFGQRDPHRNNWSATGIVQTSLKAAPKIASMKPPGRTDQHRSSFPGENRKDRPPDSGGNFQQRSDSL